MNFLRAMLLSVSICVAASAETIRVGAAISLKDALAEIAAKYDKATGDHVDFSFGSSGQILAQIRGGADLDAFVSAANQQVDDLAKEKLTDPASRRVVAANTLVLIVPAGSKDAPTGFDGLATVTGKIAVGEPKTVPAGLYAGQVFAALKITNAVAPKLVYGTNVRQVLTYVEHGEVVAGVVYATDAIQSGDKVKVVATADESTHQPIVYPAVTIAASKKTATATKFLDYLGGADARAVLKAKGFTLPDTAPPAVGK